MEHLSPAIVNDKIFPNLIHGFNDTNPVVREQTIKVSYDALILKDKFNENCKIVLSCFSINLT